MPVADCLPMFRIYGKAACRWECRWENGKTFRSEVGKFAGKCPGEVTGKIFAGRRNSGNFSPEKSPENSSGDIFAGILSRKNQKVAGFPIFPADFRRFPVSGIFCRQITGYPAEIRPASENPQAACRKAAATGNPSDSRRLSPALSPAI